ncbi:hypothetical protein EHQ24_11925 [Leptospira noumeaensis]|uniref:YiaAB two helix domain-containing protein n=2 Tax=Leptospira noumeaensis TaxID=2484964 RepID=A0A4R9I8V9_9LEPT|nr:hypothetical protein EHQ24_11925 [Leptospira noumeaensis]
MITQPQKPSAAFICASWLSLLIGMFTFIVGIWNADMMLNEKGFFGISFVLSLFAAVAVQKNVRDLRMAEGNIKPELKPKE